MKTLVLSLLCSIVLGAVACAENVQFTLHSIEDYGNYRSAHDPLFMAYTSKSWNYHNPQMELSNSYYNPDVTKDVAWTNGERAFSLDITSQGFITMGLENQQGGMDFLSLSIPAVGGHIQTFWLTAYTAEANSTATLKISTFNGSPVPNGTPIAWNTGTEGMSSLEIYGFSPSGTLSMTGYIQDPSDPSPNDKHVTDFSIEGFNFTHAPEPTSTLLLATGVIALFGRRPRRNSHIPTRINA